MFSCWSFLCVIEMLLFFSGFDMVSDKGLLQGSWMLHDIISFIYSQAFTWAYVHYSDCWPQTADRCFPCRLWEKVNQTVQCEWIGSISTEKPKLQFCLLCLFLNSHAHSLHFTYIFLQHSQMSVRRLHLDLRAVCGRTAVQFLNTELCERTRRRKPFLHCVFLRAELFPHWTCDNRACKSPLLFIIGWLV